MLLQDPTPTEFFAKWTEDQIEGNCRGDDAQTDGRGVLWCRRTQQKQKGDRRDHQDPGGDRDRRNCHCTTEKRSELAIVQAQNNGGQRRPPDHDEPERKADEALWRPGAGEKHDASKARQRDRKRQAKELNGDHQACASSCSPAIIGSRSEGVLSRGARALSAVAAKPADSGLDQRPRISRRFICALIVRKSSATCSGLLSGFTKPCRRAARASRSIAAKASSRADR